jgi:hypothetical protein
MSAPTHRQQSDSCKECGGKGKISYRTPADLEPVDMGNGTTIQSMGGWSTRACSCVKDLPALDGVATWWDMESIYSEVVGVPIGAACIEVDADCEVPRDESGRRLHRTMENAYYPPLIRMVVPGDVTLHSDSARELAAALIAAADACDKADSLARETA